MPITKILPPPPDIKINHLEDEIPQDARRFLKVHKQYLKLTYPNGTESEPFVFDTLERRGQDASAIVAHCMIDGVRHVYLRSCVRPAIGSRFPEMLNLWEIAAGVIDGDEDSRVTAMRETEEELGFSIPESQFHQLGSFIFPSVGHFSERIFIYEVEVDPNKRKVPTLDGGPLEVDGDVICVPLSKTCEAIIFDDIRDAKTEIGIRRLRDRYGF